MSMILTLTPVSLDALAKLGADPNYDALMELVDNGGVDLDKAWHGIHFMLAGVAWGGAMPAATLVSGGREIGEDVGYGPARLLSPAEVTAFDDHLKSVTPEVFDARFEAQAMLDAQIYPQIWDRDLNGEPDGRPYINEFFVVLRDCVAAAARNGDAMLVTIT